MNELEKRRYQEIFYNISRINKKLNKYDYKFMSYLYLVQLLASKFGYKQYITDN